MSIRNAVVGIVYRKDNPDVKFLVLHRVFLWKGWEFPKGGVEKSDVTKETALKRELEEETGLIKIRIIAKLPYHIKYKYPKKYADKYEHTETVQAVYLVRSFHEDVKLPKVHGVQEHDDFKWLPYKEARKILTHQQQKKALDIAWKVLQEMRLI